MPDENTCPERQLPPQVFPLSSDVLGAIAIHQHSTIGEDRSYPESIQTRLKITRRIFNRLLNGGFRITTLSDTDREQRETFRSEHPF